MKSMISTISIREYDKLRIRAERDLVHNTISTSDATYLQTVILDSNPVFSHGNRCLIAQQYVGVIELPDFTIEILPKIYGEVDNDKLRDVLVRMLLVAHQTTSLRRFKASVATKKNSLAEVVIQSFLVELKSYVDSGLQHEYKKVSHNANKVKGQIIFSQQLRKNILAPTRFCCRYSKYIVNNELNQFFKTCLVEMLQVSRDEPNRKMIENLIRSFEEMTDVDLRTALEFGITFNSVNSRAKDAYTYGRMFLESLQATMSAGVTQVYTMLFDMEKLYELFVYRVAAHVFGSRVTYQKMGNYLVSRDSDGKKFINLRPDLTLQVSDKEKWILDTKWKIPGRFAKESDVYQMNAYSTGINNVSKVILLYPRVIKNDHLVGYYKLLSCVGELKSLEIKQIDLMECLSWNDFLKSFSRAFSVPESSNDCV